MARYFFFARVGQVMATDHRGTEFPDAAAARRYALTIVSELADSELSDDGSGPEIAVEIGDGGDRPIFGIRLTPPSAAAAA